MGKHKYLKLLLGFSEGYYEPGGAVPQGDKVW